MFGLDVNKVLVLGGVALIATLLLWRAHSDREIGKLKERTRIEQVNNAQRNKADEAERNVLNCPPGKWNREARKCEPL